MGQIKNIKLHIVTDIKVQKYLHRFVSSQRTSQQHVSFPTTIHPQSCTQCQPSSTKLFLTIIRWWKCIQTPSSLRISSPCRISSYGSEVRARCSRIPSSRPRFTTEAGRCTYGTHLHNDQT